MTHAGPPLASLSLDLDNQWSYMKVHGDAGWQEYPSYLDVAIPHALRLLERHGLSITFFIVGQDAALARNRAALAAITEAGHEVGNHSFAHEPWLHLYAPDDLERDIAGAEAAIGDATGQVPRVFRGPGYSLSRECLTVLRRRGYRCDASTLPTVIGPLARLYYFLNARLTAEQRADRKQLFGSVRDGFRPVKPYRWRLDDGPMLEIPVTVMPGLRVPFHFSYILYLAGYSPALAFAYFRAALAACRAAGVEPSLLLHPLDVLGRDDVRGLDFFPGMRHDGGTKRAWVGALLGELAGRFRVVTMGGHCDALDLRHLPVVDPRQAGLPSRPEPPLSAAGGSVP